MHTTRATQTLFDDYYTMLADEVRMAAYSRAVERVVRPGDVVIDLGCGLGTLSFLAVQAGASRVYAIELSDSIELARAVAKRNGFQDKVVFIPANSKDVSLHELVRPADVLLSETLGSFALDENTLDFTIDARQRLLAPDARLIPRALKLWLAPVTSPRQQARMDFWNDIHGVNYNLALEEILCRMTVCKFTPEQLLARPVLYSDIDLATVDSPYIEHMLEFEIDRAGVIHGLAGWFEAELCDGISIATGPEFPTTHWDHAMFPFRNPIEVEPGDVLDVVLRVSPADEGNDDTNISYEYHSYRPEAVEVVATRVQTK